MSIFIKYGRHRDLMPAIFVLVLFACTVLRMFCTLAPTFPSNIYIAPAVSRYPPASHHKRIGSANRRGNRCIVRNVHALLFRRRISPGSVRPKMVFRYSRIPYTLFALDKNIRRIKSRILTQS